MEGAKVSSIDALRMFRAALIKFAETTGSALTDADADVRSTLIWLERDQSTYWKGQIRKRHDALERAKEALRHKQLYKGPAGGRQSDVDEQKMVSKCKAALMEAEQKLLAVKKSIVKLNKSMSDFLGQTQRLSTTVQAEVPASVAELDRMVRLLDEYVAMHTPSAARSTSEADAMGRGAAGAEARAVESKIDWLALRSSTPTPSVRGGAEAGLMFFGPWKSPVLKVAEQDAVQSLELKRDEPDAQQKMVLARDVNGAAAIYLERMEPAAMYDSGWYIGPADAPPAGVEVIVLSVAELLAMRPDLAKVLALPQGVLLGIDAKGLAAIYDPDDADLFAPLSEQVTIARESEREDQAAAE